MKIDCLFKNTEILEDARNLVKYFGFKRASESDVPIHVSLDMVYRDLAENGIDMDKETVGKLYAEQLSGKGDMFDSIEDLHQSTGRWWRDLTRTAMNRKPMKGEKKLGELSPAQAFLKGIAGAFAKSKVKDERTTEIRKKIEEIYTKGARLIAKAKDVNAKGPDTRTLHDLLSQIVGENDKLGYRDAVTGTVNGMRALDKEVKKLMDEFTRGITDPAIRAEWEQHISDFRRESYNMVMDSKDARQVVIEALAQAHPDYVKTDKAGNRHIDYNALTKHIGSTEQLKDAVRDAVTAQGFHQDIADRFADALEDRYNEIKTNILSAHDKNEQRIDDSWSKAPMPKGAKTIKGFIDKSLAMWKNRRQLDAQTGVPHELKFSKQDAKSIISDALKNSADYGKTLNNGDKAIDWHELAYRKPTEQEIRDLVNQHLQDIGLQGRDAISVRDAIAQAYPQVDADIAEHGQKILDARQDAIGNTAKPERKSLLRQLAEYGSLGVFDRAHDNLIMKMTGVNAEDIEAMGKMEKLAKDYNKIYRQVGGKTFLAKHQLRELQRQMDDLTADAVNNRTKTLKKLSVLKNIIGAQNYTMVQGYVNTLRNFATHMHEQLVHRYDSYTMGIDVNQAAYNKIAANSFKDVTMGGEIGAEHYASDFAHKQNFLHTLSLRGSKEEVENADSTKEKAQAYAKRVVAITTLAGRAGVHGLDGFYMVGNQMRTFVQMAFLSLTKNGMNKEQANSFLNDALFSEGAEGRARVKVDNLYQQIGMYASESTRQAATRDMMLDQLTIGGEFTPDQINMMLKSSYKLVGLGIGHSGVVNNEISKRLTNSRMQYAREQRAAIQEGNWGKLAKLNAYDTVWNGYMMRFASTVVNWGWIKLQQTGLGLATGFIEKNKALKTTDKILALDPAAKDYEEKRDALRNEANEQYLHGRKAYTRAIQGMVAQALTDVSLHAIASIYYKDDDDKGSAYDQLMAFFSQHKVLSSVFMGITGPVVYGDYLRSRANREAAEHNRTPVAAGTQAAVGVMSQLFGYGDRYDTQVEMFESMHQLALGGKPAKQAIAEFALSLGKFFQIPIIHNLNQEAQVIRWMATGKEPTSQFPIDAGESFIKGTGLYETGILKMNPSIETLPGVGEKAVQALNDAGVYKISDLEGLSEYGQRQVLSTAGLSDKQIDKAVESYQRNYADE